MRLIIPMAGMGKRVRPLSLTTPKPLLKIAGKSIVQRLIEQLIETIPQKINEVGFVIGNFPKEVKEQLTNIAQSLDLKPYFFIQNVPLGTAHAIFMANQLLQDEVIIAFADTLFFAQNPFTFNADAIIFTKYVNDPSQYGVVVVDNNNNITKFVEKPKQPISNQAIVGIYYFKNGELLKYEIEYLLKNNITGNGEYQLTDALSNMLKKGVKFKTYQIDQWLDCGNLSVLLKTNAKILDYIQSSNTEKLTNSNPENSVIIPPVYIGKNSIIKNSVIGPYVSIEDNVEINNSIISNSIIYDNAKIENANITESVIGKEAYVKQLPKNINISDFSNIKL